MRLDTFQLIVPLQVAAGTAQSIRDYDHKTVVVSGTFNATLELEASIDGGTSWFTVMIFVGPNEVTLDGELPLVRVNTTAYVDGTPIVKIVGRHVAL